MAYEFKGKRIVLTGASSGIGRALAEDLGKAGAHLALAARSSDKLNEVVRSLAGVTKAVAIPTDVAVAEERSRLIDEAVKQLGGLDLLINNAGVASWGHFSNSDEAVMREIMEVNFFAPVELMHLAIPHLTRGKEPVIVNISSMCGRRAMPAWSEYSASKFALCGITEALRGEMARFEIEVILAVPGLAKTNLRDNMCRHEGRAQIDFDKGMEPTFVAAKIVEGIRRGKREIVIGSDAKWMLRMQRWFPRLVDYLVARKVKQLYATQVKQPTAAP